MLDGVAHALTSGQFKNVTGAGQFAVAATGMLAWVRSPVVPYPDAALVTVDRRGQITPLAAPVRSYGAPMRVSRDGHRLAVTVQTLTEAGVWVYDIDRGTLTLLAGGGEATWPMWWPGGRRLLFDWLVDGRRTLATQPADGTAPPQTLAEGAFNPSSVTPDSRQVAVVTEPGVDILIATVEHGQARVQPLIQTPRREGWAEFSPDGRWLAYASDVSGRGEVYVRPYPGPGPAEPVSGQHDSQLTRHRADRPQRVQMGILHDPGRHQGPGRRPSHSVRSPPRRECSGLHSQGTNVGRFGHGESGKRRISVLVEPGRRRMSARGTGRNAP